MSNLPYYLCLPFVLNYVTIVQFYNIWLVCYVGQFDAARSRLKSEIQRVKDPLTGKDDFCKVRFGPLWYL